MQNNDEKANRQIERIEEIRRREQEQTDTDFEKSIRNIPAMQPPEPWPEPPPADSDQDKDQE